MLGRNFLRRVDPQEAGAPEPAPADDLIVGGEITLSLPSSDEALLFQVRLVVEAKWLGEPPPGFAGIANNAIADRAERVSRRYRLTAAEQLKGALSAALFLWQDAPGTDVYVRGHCAAVVADAELVAAIAAREAAASRRFAFSWQDERRSQQAEQMRSRLLDPLRATANWYLDNPDKPDRLVEIAQAFQQAREILAPDDLADSAGRLVDELIASNPVAGHRLTAILRKVFADCGRQDLSTRLANCEDAESA
ncbi:hypothetical protein [Kibdelosporangium phytohabitans]|uniref:Uncharacterized protein n=1 Tax=Kibdelosporangium phytohabitans TaxID=860235 RepID=A0A0N9I0W5_9PSEU|nr:hypothetical protein [Kibdelosporangium phytohabitans]ALG09652.1 hypothetical protein AOZ06_24555 [Kibdelosporangium phytohabitans]MBE1469004.1 hypothetical protein [Kibdelosporangium phytohabitans]